MHLHRAGGEIPVDLLAGVVSWRIATNRMNHGECKSQSCEAPHETQKPRCSIIGGFACDPLAWPDPQVRLSFETSFLFKLLLGRIVSGKQGQVKPDSLRDRP